MSKRRQFQFLGMKRERAHNVPKAWEGVIETTLRTKWDVEGWSKEHILQHLKDVHDITLTKTQLSDRMKKFKQRRREMGGVQTTAASPTLSGVTPNTATADDISIFTPRSNAVSLDEGTRGPAIAPDNDSPLAPFSSYSLELGSNFSRGLNWDARIDRLAVTEFGEWHDKKDVSNVLGNAELILVDQDTHARQGAAAITATDSHIPNDKDEMEVDSTWPLHTGEAAQASVAHARGDGWSSPDDFHSHDENMDIDDESAANINDDSSLASYARLARDLEQILVAPESPEEMTQKPGLSASTTRSPCLQTLATESLHGPDLLCTSSPSPSHQSIQIYIEDHFGSLEPERMLAADVLGLERLFNVVLSCGWTQQAMECFKLLFGYWLPKNVRPLDSGPGPSPFLHVTNLLIRMLQMQAKTGDETDLVDRWITRQDEKQALHAQQHMRMCCEPEEIVAIRQLCLVLYKLGHRAHFDHACRLLAELGPERRRLSNRSHAQERWVVIADELAQIAGTSKVVSETESLFASALQNVLSWIQNQLVIATSVSVSQHDVDIDMLWHRSPSVEDLELLEKRLMVVFLCNQTWQLGVKNGPPVRANLHGNLPPSLSQEWRSGDVPFLTFAILSHMATGSWTPSLRPDPHSWHHRRLQAVQQLAQSPAETARQFCEIAEQVDRMGASAVLQHMHDSVGGYGVSALTDRNRTDGSAPMNSSEYEEHSSALIWTLVRAPTLAQTGSSPPAGPGDNDLEEGCLSHVGLSDDHISQARLSSASYKYFSKRTSEAGSRLSGASSYLYRPSITDSFTHEYLGSLSRASRSTTRYSNQFHSPPLPPSTDDLTVVVEQDG